MGEDTSRNEVHLKLEEILKTAEVKENKRLWNLEEKLLAIDKRSWKNKEKVLESAHASVKGKEEFLELKEKVSTQKEMCFEQEDQFVRRKEKKAEEALSKLGENCLGGSLLRSDWQEAQELLPSLPNELTLHHITTKLSWRETLILTSVTRGWYNAIRNRSVHDAKVRSHSTKTYFLMRYSKSDSSLPLHCWGDNSCVELPRIPYHNESNSSTFAAVDGKVYVLGGLFGSPSDKVYMFDLAAIRPWTRVASMQIPRADFGCGVVDGKIFVFGGQGRFDKSLCEAEVYDPKENRWSFIAPRSSLNCDFQVATVGEEFFVYNRTLTDGDRIENLNTLEIYNPAKDEWRKVEPFTPPPATNIFSWERKVYSLDQNGIHLYSFGENLWTKLYTHLHTGIINSANPHTFVLSSVRAIEDGLLCLGLRSTSDEHRAFVIRSIGFDTEKEVVRWQEEGGWSLLNILPFIYPVEL